MATLTVATVSRAGVDLGAAAAAAGGDEFVNTGKEILYIKDTAGGGLTLTIATPGTSDGLAVAERTVVIANNEEKLIGPFQPTGLYNDGDGRVQLTYSDVTGVTVAVFNPGL